MMLVLLSMVLAGSAPTPIDCGTIVKRASASTSVRVNNSFRLPLNQGVHWKSGVPPQALGQIFDSDSAAWTRADMDGDGSSELIVQTHLLQNRWRGYYNLTTFYIFCDAQAVPCLRANLSSPPTFETVDSERKTRTIDPPRFKHAFPVDPPLDVGLIRV